MPAGITNILTTECSKPGHVELPRQVRVGLVAQEYLGELLRNRRGVEELVRREPGGRAADDVADIVHAGLERDQADAF